MRLLTKFSLSLMLLSGLPVLPYYFLVPAWHNVTWKHQASRFQSQLLRKSLPLDTQVVSRQTQIYGPRTNGNHCNLFSGVLLRTKQDYAAIVKHYTLLGIKLDLSIGKITDKHFYWNVLGDKTRLSDSIVPEGIQQLAKLADTRHSQANYIVIYKIKTVRRNWDYRCH